VQDLFKEDLSFDLEYLLALRLVFDNKGLLKLINSNLTKEEILNLKELGLKSLNFKNIKRYEEGLKNIEKYLIFSKDVLEQLNKDGIKIISIFDKDYPERLRRIELPPVLIFCKGNLSLLDNKKNIAFVGTRKCSELGASISFKTSAFFAENKFNIISGLAKGIDESAHKGALSVAGLTTAVLVDIKSISPNSNKNLVEEILQKNGLLLSENVPGTTQGEPFLFLERNRIQSAISEGVFVIESSLKSGTAKTVEYALKQGKQIYCPDFSQVETSSFEENRSLNKKLIETFKALPFTNSDYQEIIDNLS
tara:strand:- start:1121 stop:2044 length:924 start_codon:yes stop_codon:yes gene_type:complete